MLQEIFFTPDWSIMDEDFMFDIFSDEVEYAFSFKCDIFPPIQINQELQLNCRIKTNVRIVFTVTEIALDIKRDEDWDDIEDNTLVMIVRYKATLIKKSL